MRTVCTGVILARTVAAFCVGEQTALMRAIFTRVVLAGAMGAFRFCGEESHNVDHPEKSRMPQ